MNKRQLEVEKKKLAEEAQELKHLKAIYNKAAEDIAKNISITDGKMEVLLANWDDLSDDDKSVYQSKIYQRNYQRQLQKQINDVLKDLNSGQYKSIDEYLKKCYETGYIGSMYDIAGQGIPVIAPIDQKKVIRAMKTNSKISKGLYTKLGEDVDYLKKRIANNISRGIATADSYENIARNISNASNVGFNKSMRIARTEGHRIHSNSAHDAQLAAKEAGADIVKQWNSTLDGKTRPHHRQLDGQIREVEEPFEMGGMKAMYPSDFGRPEEDINCRCALMQRAKWALDDDELETLKKRAEYFGLDKTDSFNDFRQKYLKASIKVANVTTPETVEQLQQYGIDKLKKHGVDVDIADVGKLVAEGKANVDYLDNLLSEYNSTCVSYKIVKGSLTEGGSAYMLNGRTSIKVSRRTLRTNKAADQLGLGANQYLGTTCHEFAHSLSQSNEKTDPDFWKELRKIKRDYSKERNGVNWFNVKISDYADTNIDEFLAEAFTQAKLSNNPSPYAIKVLETVDKYFKKPLANTGKKSTIVSGAISGARNPLSEEAKEHAKRYYGLVRSMTTDVAKISKTTGVPERDIQAIKDFIFNDKHDLGDGKIERFDPDYMMAESWRRLIAGEPEKHDYTLISHELMEKRLMDSGMTQDEAHIKTSAKYNYDKEAKRYYAEIEKHKKK